MKPKWLEWLEENMPEEMRSHFNTDWKWNGEWRDRQIAALTAKLARATELAKQLSSLVSYDELENCIKLAEKALSDEQAKEATP